MQKLKEKLILSLLAGAFSFLFYAGNLNRHVRDRVLESKIVEYVDRDSDGFEVEELKNFLSDYENFSSKNRGKYNSWDTCLAFSFDRGRIELKVNHLYDRIINGKKVKIGIEGDKGLITNRQKLLDFLERDSYD